MVSTASGCPLVVAAVRYTVGVIRSEDLTTLAQARLADAQALHAALRHDGAVYVCGYAVELALKARICTALNWSGYPSNRAEFQQYLSFRTHDLDVLLHLSGLEPTVRAQFLADWSVVTQWDPEIRYRAVGTTSDAWAATMIASTTALLEVL